MTADRDRIMTIHDVISAAYPMICSLQLALFRGTGRDLDDIVSDDVRPVRILSLVRVATAQGWQSDLILAMLDDSDQVKNEARRAALEQFLPEQPQAAALDGRAPASLHGFLARLQMVNACVGRFEVDGIPRGTCFLADPDLVLTNFHVAETINGNGGGRYAVRFDFHRPPDDLISPGWTEPVGEMAVPSTPSGTQRDWCVLDPALRLPEADAYVTLIQYANWKPQQLTIGVLLGRRTESHRLRYPASTRPGSSGAPVLNHDGAIVAMHEARFTAYPGFPEKSHGVYVPQIAADLCAQGLLPQAPA